MTTETQRWHADPALLARYLAGALDAVTGASVEQHVSRCESCRRSMGPLLEPGLVDGTWAGIRDAVERPPLPHSLRLARRCGLSEPTAVLLAGAASLRSAWLVGAFLSLSFATLAAYVSGGTALAPFLLIAPLAPVLGVAAAYGPRQDPLEALVATAPYGRTRLILLRTLAVLVSVLPVTALLGLAVPGPPSGSPPRGSGRPSRWCRCCWRWPASSAPGSRQRSCCSDGPPSWSPPRAAAWTRHGRSKPVSRASTSHSPWPPARSSRSGSASTRSGGWRCECHPGHGRALRRGQAVRPQARARRRRPHLRPRRDGAARSQRRRQDHAAAHRRHLDRRRRRRSGCSGATRTVPTRT